MDLFSLNQTEPKALTVSEITYRLKNMIEVNFTKVMIEGEISNFKKSYTGHAYFTLKDQSCEISAVMFKSSLDIVKFPLVNGQKIIASGKIILFEQRGVYQINVQRVLPAGQGLLQLKFEELKKKLFERGWFDESKKKKLPEYPETIGVITSPAAAAFQDIINVIKRRYPKVKLYLYPVTVQGDTAKFEIVSAFNYFNKNSNVDIIILARGGGSIEDLWAFNEEIVAEAVYNSKIPVITGVGHEIDFTIVDFVSDMRAPTPSAAAEMAVPDIMEIQDLLHSLKRRFLRELTSKAAFFRDKINNIRQSKYFKKPLDKIDNYKILIDDYQSRMRNNILNKINFYKKILHTTNFNKQLTIKINSNRERLKKNEKLLFYFFNNQISNKKKLLAYSKESITKTIINKPAVLRERLKNLTNNFIHLNPLNILDRGYSIVYDKNQKVISSVVTVNSGDSIDIKLKDGKLLCQVHTPVKL